MQTTFNIKAIKPGTLLLAAIPIIYLEGLRLLLGETFSFSRLALTVLFTIFVFLLAGWLKYVPIGKNIGKYNLAWPILVSVCLVCAVVAAASDSQIIAWIGFAAFLALSLGIQDLIGGQGYSLRWWLSLIPLGAVTVLVSVLFNQALLRFSEEEFFTALQAGFLFIFWFLLAAGHTTHKDIINFRTVRGLRVKNKFLVGVCILILGLFSLIIIRIYQSSFFTTEVETYPGISNNNPFLCGTTASQEKAVDSKTFYQDYIQEITANPNLQAPDGGLLFIATGDPKWATAFHDSLLHEASQNLYTGPANSVKFDQYLAALRVYAYSQVRIKKPDLFTKQEQVQIENWFHAINRRAMTVEWVDILYGLAFSYVPQGPYENQENGAGLIALLEAEHLSDPDLSLQNQTYLLRHPLGWATRFHNTDDSLNYQAEWITNAYFQKIYSGSASAQNIKNSFEWVYLQMLPDGRAPQYNLPIPYSLAQTLYVGATLLNDSQYLWLADKAIHAAKNSQIPLNMQPGTEKPLNLNGDEALSQGSCLLYSDSGLPTQVGPLAPDKIVFRDGWAPNDTYLLLNLRFTGWHRYKGTNTITLFDKGGPLISEEITGDGSPWLPKGRSSFRDKRIPRQNLNGLQIPRTGFDAVLYQLLGYGGPWAQDPPFYAQVDQFTTASDMDISQTSLVDWHSWTQNRKIYFAHNGITVILDDAKGPISQSSQITWNTMSAEQTSEGRFLLASQSSKVEMVLLTQKDGSLTVAQSNGTGDSSTNQIIYNSPANGHLHLVTILLSGDWLGAQINLANLADRDHLEIKQSGKTFQLDLNLVERK